MKHTGTFSRRHCRKEKKEKKREKNEACTGTFYRCHCRKEKKKKKKKKNEAHRDLLRPCDIITGTFYETSL
jgi:hypothetical protein